MTTNAGFPADPEGFGRDLRRMREGAGLSVEDIAAETKISPRILRALEEGKFQYLPEKVFSRNFVRQIARILGVDGDRLVESFEAAWSRFETMSGTHPVVLAVHPEPQPTIRWRLVVPAVLAAVAIVVAGVVIWRTWHRPAGVPGLGVQGAPAAASAVPSPTMTSAVGVEVQPSPPPATEVPEETTVSFSVEVRPLAECWIRYRDATGRTLRETVPGGGSRSFTLPSPVRLTLGNAGAVTVSLNGSRYSNLGSDGQVVHLEVTPAGLHRLRPGAGDG